MTARNKSTKYGIIIILLILATAAYFIYNLQSSNKLPVVQPAPDFELEELSGGVFKLSEQAGKVMLMEFMFTSCPDICPATTYNMVLLQDELNKQGIFGKNVQFAAITFDPNTDTPEVFQAYAERMGIDQSGWRLLRGDEEYTIQKAKEYGIGVQRLADNQFVHTVTSLLLIDANQQVRKVYRMGEEMDNGLILKDIRSLLKER
ncbi:SCO family protein [Paenibacillus paridis]|uniref:SCO family protein n=1 Tax=Paenibacillus paridis TaxID=2583376 RepID=UPI001121455C|nr:SCO family protein [Paenibacillus paridis]